MQTMRLIPSFVREQEQEVSDARYRTGGTGVSVIGLFPDISPRNSDGRLLGWANVNAVFSGWDTISASHAGSPMGDDTVPANPDWSMDSGFGLWFYEPNANDDITFYGRTGGTRDFGPEAGNRYKITVRAAGASGWAECDFEVRVQDPDLGESAPLMTEMASGNPVIELGAISAAPGDTIADMASYLITGSKPVPNWWIYSGDPTHLSGTPTFRMDGGLLKLHWPSVSYSASAISLVIGGASADGIFVYRPRTVAFNLTATATADPGIPPGWTLPPGPISAY